MGRPERHRGEDVELLTGMPYIDPALRGHLPLADDPRFGYYMLQLAGESRTSVRASVGDIKERLTQAKSMDEVVQLIIDGLSEKPRRTLQIGAGDAFDANTSLLDHGIDSISATAVRNWCVAACPGAAGSGIRFELTLVAGSRRCCISMCLSSKSSEGRPSGTLPPKKHQGYRPLSFRRHGPVTKLRGRTDRRRPPSPRPTATRTALTQRAQAHSAPEVVPHPRTRGGTKYSVPDGIIPGRCANHPMTCSTMKRLRKWHLKPCTRQVAASASRMITHISHSSRR